MNFTDKFGLAFLGEWRVIAINTEQLNGWHTIHQTVMCLPKPVILALKLLLSCYLIAWIS